MKMKKKKKIKVLMLFSLLLFVFFSVVFHYTSGKGMGPLSWSEILKYSWIIILASVATSFFIVDAMNDEEKNN